MSAFLTLDSITLDAPDGRRLFEGLTLAIGRERTGVVGRNGCGKTSLLRLIAGQVEPATGTMRRHGRIGMLAQSVDDAVTAAEALGVRESLARLERLEAGAGSVDDAGEADWTLQARLAAALAQMGLPDLTLERPLAGFSGGERTRLALARLLLDGPDVLVLDEPSNNLDADGRRAVVELLETWPGGVVLASHDRDLLERVDRIVELTPVGITLYGGAWPQFVEARDAARSRAETELDRSARAVQQAKREAQLARERQDRRDKAGRAKRARADAPKMVFDFKAEQAEHSAARSAQVSGRLLADRAETLDDARARVEVLTPLAIDLPASGLPRGRELLAFDAVEMRQGQRRLFGPLSFDLRGPERVAVAGPNGAGKTTLLRLITGDEAPSAGRVRRLTDRVALLDQHVAVLQPEASILDNLRRLNPGLTEHEARAVLARFAFRNKAALQPAATLSGGERMRAGLACAFASWRSPELLLLDEPTNHLDLAATEELERALAGYDGAVIAVSHDPAFLEAIGVRRTIDL